MKKVLKGILIFLLIIAATVGFMWGKEYMENKEIENIVKSEDGKEAIGSIDDKALTSEGKIKSYKIDYNKVEKNPMGGINVYLIINDDPEMKLNTILVKGTQGKKYEAGAPGRSPKFDKLTNELEE